MTNATLVKVVGILTSWSDNTPEDRIEIAICTTHFGTLTILEVRSGKKTIFRHEANLGEDPMESGLRAIVKMAKDILDVPGVLVQDVMES